MHLRAVGAWPGGCSLRGQSHVQKDGGAHRQLGVGAHPPGPRSVRRALEQHHGGSERPHSSASGVGGQTISFDGRGTLDTLEPSTMCVLRRLCRHSGQHTAFGARCTVRHRCQRPPRREAGFSSGGPSHHRGEARVTRVTEVLSRRGGQPLQRPLRSLEVTQTHPQPLPRPSCTY